MAELTEESSTNSLDSSERDFRKLESNLRSAGFREGAGVGKDNAFQSGFDAGYAEGFKAAFSLGKFNGVVEALKRNAESLSIDQQELEGLSFDNARHGLCQICKASRDESPCSCKNTQDIASLSATQQGITKETYREKLSTCLPIFEKTGLSNLVLNAIE